MSDANPAIAVIGLARSCDTVAIERVLRVVQLAQLDHHHLVLQLRPATPRRVVNGAQHDDRGRGWVA